MSSEATSAGRIRCFVAASFPSEVRSDFERLQQRLKERGLDLKWVRPGSMHLTLKFLGEPTRQTFEAVMSALEAPLGVPGPLRLEPRGLGAFPSARRARVVWVGLSGDAAPLARLAMEVERRVEAVGIPREARPFAPHLTLGRSRSPAGIPGLESALAAEAEYVGPAFTVEELTLYESRLRPQGPLYIPRKTIPLSG